MNNVKLSKEMEKELISLISKDGFLEYLVKYNIKEVEGKKYSDVVYNACRYGVLYGFYAIANKDKNLLKYVRVVNGVCRWRQHCWLMIGDYYIDVTIAQFDDKYPEILAIKKENAKEYDLNSIEVYTVEEWFIWEENND